MASLFRTIFGCCLRGSETDKQGEPERQPLLEPPGGNNQAPPEVISSTSTVSDDQRNTALKQRLNIIVSSASHGMRSAPSQHGTHYGTASAGQTPSSSNAPPSQLQGGATGGTGGAQVSRVGSRRSLPHPQAQQAQGPGFRDTSSVEAIQGATSNVVPSSVSNLTHRVRTSLPGPGSRSGARAGARASASASAGASAGAGGSGASSSPSPNQQGRPHSDEEPERGRRRSGTKDVLDRLSRRPSVASPSASKPVSKDPYTRRETMDIPSPNGKSPSYTKTNGGVGSFKLPQDDELILQYD